MKQIKVNKNCLSTLSALVSLIFCASCSKGEDRHNPQRASSLIGQASLFNPNSDSTNPAQNSGNEQISGVLVGYSSTDNHNQQPILSECQHSRLDLSMSPVFLNLDLPIIVMKNNFTTVYNMSDGKSLQYKYSLNYVGICGPYREYSVVNAQGSTHMYLLLSHQAFEGLMLSGTYLSTRNKILGQD